MYKIKEKNGLFYPVIEKINWTDGKATVKGYLECDIHGNYYYYPNNQTTLIPKQPPFKTLKEAKECIKKWSEEKESKEIIHDYE